MAPTEANGLHRNLDAHLNKLGMKKTRQRHVILDAILKLGTHVDAETIALEAKQIDPSIGLATVYRTLQLMVECKILAEKHFGRERTHFEVISAFRQHHDHLICRQCGKITEFFNDEIETLQEKIATQHGFELYDHHMELMGNCTRGGNCPNLKN